MSPRTKKVKPNEQTPLKIPECENVGEDQVWYPPDWFLIEIHDMMIKRYGGWEGLDLGLEPYHNIIKEAKDADGIFRKASILLKEIATTRIFQDGHHRTAYVITKTFLEKNDAEFKEKDDRKVIKFIKDIRQYNINQIEGWLKDGKL